MREGICKAEAKFAGELSVGAILDRGHFIKGLFQVGPFEEGPSVRGHLDQACLQKIPNDYSMVEVVGVKMMRGKTDVTIPKLDIATCHLWGHRTILIPFIPYCNKQ